MGKKSAAPGRPKTSPLTRTEQLREAKRAQRRRQRAAGVTTIELRLPAEQAERLRAVAHTPHFQQTFDRFLQDQVLDINAWPALRELAWNRADRWIPAKDALALYERNWRFVEPERLTQAEADLIDSLKQRFGGGVLNV